jgi:cytochrome P450
VNERILKSPVYKSLVVTPGVYDVLTETDPTVHSFRRKLIGKAVSERSMRIFEPVMETQIDIFLELLRDASQNRTPVNMATPITRLALDVVGLLAFGHQMNTQMDTRYRHFTDAQIIGNYIANIFMQWPFVYQCGIVDLLEKIHPSPVLAYNRGIEEMIAGRVAEGKSVRHDLYSVVADELNPKGDSLQDSDMWAEASFFLVAGADTVSTLLSAALFYLSRTPRAYERLAQEVRSAFTAGSEIRGGRKLTSCEYLRATLDEALRLCPPVPGTLWREVDPKDSKDPIVIDGHVIPPGVEFGVHTFSLHHNEDIFPDAFAFRPERWIKSETPPEEMKVMQEAFNPFSVGARSCAGKAMAYLESTVVMAKIFWYFDFEAVPGKLGQLGAGGPGMGLGREKADEFQIYDGGTAIRDGPNLILVPRKEPAL